MNISNINNNILDENILLFICYYFNININIIKDNILNIYYIDEKYDKSKKEIIVLIDKNNYIICNNIIDVINKYNKKTFNIYTMLGLKNDF